MGRRHRDRGCESSRLAVVSTEGSQKPRHGRPTAGPSFDTHVECSVLFSNLTRGLASRSGGSCVFGLFATLRRWDVSVSTAQTVCRASASVAVIAVTRWASSTPLFFGCPAQQSETWRGGNLVLGLAAAALMHGLSHSDKSLLALAGWRQAVAEKRHLAFVGEGDQPPINDRARSLGRSAPRT